MTKTMSFRVRIDADPASIWQYITEPEHLTRWFCEHASVDLPNGRYEFWGRSTPGALEDPVTELLNYEEGGSLRYRWEFAGLDTFVEVALRADAGGTVVEVLHQGFPAWQPGEFSFDDFWGLALEHLRLYAAGEQNLPLPDLSQPASDIRIEYRFNTSASEVFQGLTDPQLLDRYIASKAEVDLREGGTITYGWGEHAGPSTILELRPDQRLGVNWAVGENGPATVVTWTLEEENGRTRMTLVHNGFGDRTGLDHICGWMMYLARLRGILRFGDRWERVRREVVSESARVDR